MPQRHLLDVVRGPADAAGRRVEAALARFADPRATRRQALEAVETMTRAVLEAFHPAPAGGVILLPILRAGAAMWPAANAHFGYPASCFAIGRKAKGTDRVSVTLSAFPASLDGPVVILDPIVATGDTLIETLGQIERLRPGLSCHVVACYAAPAGLARVAAHPIVAGAAAAALAQSVDSAGFLVPPINGDAGDRLFGPNPAAAPVMAERLPAVDRAIETALATPVLAGDPPATAADLMACLAASGAACYVSGGCVRDSLHGLAPNDIDITVAMPIAEAARRLAARFGDSSILLLNEAFGVCRVGGGGGVMLDINMMRDVDSVAGHKKLFAVSWRPGHSLLSEARVRDFTINALFWSAAEGLVDPTGLGLAHNRSRTLSICADPRKAAIDRRLALRLALFAARGFRPDPAALAFFAERIDGDVRAFGAGLAPYLDELTRGSAALRHAVATFAATAGASSATCRRLAEAQRADGDDYVSYLAPGSLRAI